MGLPAIPRRTATVDVGGVDVEIRGLSRVEAIKLATFAGDLEAAENFVIAVAVGVTEDEALAWRTTTDADLVEPLVERIVELSGLGDSGKVLNGVS